MINESKVTSVDLVTCSESIEDSILELGKATYNDQLFLNNNVNTFTQALSNSTLKELSSFIHYVFKLNTVNEDEPVQIINMNLYVVIELLSMKEDKNFCDLVYKAVYTKSPNLMTAIGRVHGYNYDHHRNNRSNEYDIGSNTGVSGVIKDSSSSSNGLASDHWKYVEELVTSVSDGSDCFSIEALAFMYKSSFVHGFKHGVEEVELQLNNKEK